MKTIILSGIPAVEVTTVLEYSLTSHRNPEAIIIMTQIKMLVLPTGELDPRDAQKAFGWNNNEACYYLDISHPSLKSYSFRTGASSKTKPSERTLRRCWERAKMVLDEGIVPVAPEHLPEDLRAYIKQPASFAAKLTLAS